MNRSRAHRAVPLLFTLAAMALFVSLGVWQIKRLHWKEGLLSQISAAEARPALGSLPETPAEWANAQYRKAVLTGEYLGASLRYIGHETGGYVYYTPFKLEDSDQIVLVDRGWIPGGGNAAPPKGIVTVRGYLRAPRGKRLFSPPNHPDKNLWFTENPGEMSTALRLPLPPLILDTTPRIPLRNDHLGYAITWFALALVAAGMYWAWRRESRSS